MPRPWLLGLALLACDPTPSAEPRSPRARTEPRAPTPTAEARAPTPRPSPVVRSPSAEPFVPDSSFGPLVAALSEPPGDFPSDNYVSNETTVLDVAAQLQDPALAGRAYIGVGPEQNLTYVALARPRVAYLLDIRRGNLLEHLVLRAAIEPAATPAAFLAGLTSRPPPEGVATLPEVLAALSAAPASTALQGELLARTDALAARLALPLSAEDRESIRDIVQAFFQYGVNIKYSMDGTRRPYPTLAEMLLARGGAGAVTFAADPAAYAFVRDLVRRNAVVPVVGDFAGPHALRAIAVDMRARGLVLGAFYTSNVEEYLFQAGTFAAFADNVRVLPVDARSLVVRVWFDRSRPHPLQREGQRMATVAMPVSRMLDRPASRPYRSYFQVMTDGLP